MDDERTRQKMIAAGLRLELIETLPEHIGETLVTDLQKAWGSQDQAQILAALKRVGDTIHSYWGNPNPTKAIFQAVDGKYMVGLSSQTAGTRLLMNTAPSAPYSGDLIFPNVNLTHKGRGGMTLAETFEAIFGALAENIHAGSKDPTPYYRVKIASMERK